MKLLIGLGNPGQEYSKTRHNIGFMVVDALAGKKNIPVSLKKNLSAEVGKVTDLILAKPTTFMNNSGLAVRKLMDVYAITPADIIVAHDELDLDFGQYKLSFGSGSAGHNGVTSIIEHLSTKDFWRLRIGIGNEHLRQLRLHNKTAIADFVISDFSEPEQEHLPLLIDSLIQELHHNAPLP